MSLRGVLFDATGTLIELREPVGVTYARVAREYGVDLSARRLDEAFGRAFRSAPAMVFPGETPERIRELERDWWLAVVRRTIQSAGVEGEDVARFRDFELFFENLYATYATPECWKARPGSLEILPTLRTRGLAIGVVSNLDHRLTKILEGIGFKGLFDFILLPSEAGVQKPDPAIFRLALERMGLAAAQVAFIGDDALRDLSGAREIGMTAIDAHSMVTLEELPNHLALP